MRRIALALIVFLFCLSGLCQAGTVSFTYGINAADDPIPPRLRYPINEIAILPPGEPLEFTWWNDLVDTRVFILKIYKGYNMYADNLIVREELSHNASTYNADSALFNDGQVYTWSLVRVTSAGYKSDRSFNSFKVVRNNG
ncbi:MAG: hypothetical protein WC561_03835 [Candidatus Omnitrophota bacterium]|jgi:hypothetical protein